LWQTYWKYLKLWWAGVDNPKSKKCGSPLYHPPSVLMCLTTVTIQKNSTYCTLWHITHTAMVSC